MSSHADWSARLLRPWAVAAALSALSIALLAGHAHAQPMRASYYGAESGHRTASGAPFDPNGLTAAHRSWPFGTHLRICYRGCVTVTINDRGPYVAGRSLDVARGAAHAIGLDRVGVATIDVDRLD